MTAFPFAFSKPPARGAACLRLDGLGLIRATGPEAQGFLQSQLSNDSKLITPAQGQLSGYCSPKGRLLAVFTVLQLGADDFGLALPAALVVPTLKRLKMFVLRSKLTLTDASAELPALGLMGDPLAELLSAQGFVVPTFDYGVVQHDGVWLLRRPGPVPRFELRAAPARLATLQQALNLPLSQAEDWALAELLAGIPQVTAETSDEFVPQTINLDTAGGVSFTKGCYPGQEIVARVHYLGRVKQRLRLAQGAQVLAPGTGLLDAAGASVAKVMAAATHPQLGAVLALSLDLSHADDAPLHTADDLLQVTPQPL